MMNPSSRPYAPSAFWISLFLAAVLASPLAAAEPIDVISVRFECSPIGAQISILPKVAKRSCPYVASYRVSDSETQLGYFVLSPIIVTWPSGVTNTLSKIRVNISNGRQQFFKIQRPAGDGIELDLAVAKRIEAEEKAEQVQREYERKKHVYDQQIRNRRQEEKDDRDGCYSKQAAFQMGCFMLRGTEAMDCQSRMMRQAQQICD